MKESANERPRACIYLRKDMKYFIMQGYCSMDVVAVRITTKINSESREINNNTLFGLYGQYNPRNTK